MANNSANWQSMPMDQQMQMWQQMSNLPQDQQMLMMQQMANSNVGAPATPSMPPLPNGPPPVNGPASGMQQTSSQSASAAAALHGSYGKQNRSTTQGASTTNKSGTQLQGWGASLPVTNNNTNPYNPESAGTSGGGGAAASASGWKGGTNFQGATEKWNGATDGQWNAAAPANGSWGASPDKWQEDNTTTWQGDQQSQTKWQGDQQVDKWNSNPYGDTSWNNGNQQKTNAAPTMPPPPPPEENSGAYIGINSYDTSNKGYDKGYGDNKGSGRDHKYGGSDKHGVKKYDDKEFKQDSGKGKGRGDSGKGKHKYNNPYQNNRRGSNHGSEKQLTADAQRAKMMAEASNHGAEIAAMAKAAEVIMKENGCGWEDDEWGDDSWKKDSSRRRGKDQWKKKSPDVKSAFGQPPPPPLKGFRKVGAGLNDRDGGNHLRYRDQDKYPDGKYRDDDRYHDDDRPGRNSGRDSGRGKGKGKSGNGSREGRSNPGEKAARIGQTLQEKLLAVERQKKGAVEKRSVAQLAQEEKSRKQAAEDRKELLKQKMLEKLKQVREQQGASAKGDPPGLEIGSGRSTPKLAAERFADDMGATVQNLLAMDRTNFLQIVNAVPVPDCPEKFFDDEILPEENFDAEVGKMHLDDLIQNSKNCEDMLPEAETTARTSDQPATPRNLAMTQVLLVKKIMGAKRLAARYFAHVRAEIMEETDEAETSSPKRRRM